MNIEHLHIGYIDWIKDSEYGMVRDLESKSNFFFHLNNNPLILDLKKDYYVIFETFYEKNKKQECAKNIVRVGFIEDEGLLNKLIEKFKTSSNNIIISELNGNSTKVEKFVNSLRNQIKKIEYCSNEELSDLKNKPELVKEYIDSKKFKLLRPQKIVEYFHDYIQENILTIVESHPNLLNSFNDQNGIKIFDKLVYNIEKIDDDYSFKIAQSIIHHSKVIGPKTKNKLITHFINVSSSLYKIKFWLKGFNIEDYKSHLNYIYFDLAKEENLLRDILNKLDNLKQLKILEEILEEKLLNTDLITSSEYDNIWRKIIESITSIGYIDSKNIKEHINHIFLKSDEIVKLNMWLNGITDLFDFDAYKIACISLVSEEQESFIKRIFKYAEEGKIELSIDMLKDIQLFDRELSDKLGINYTLDIILSTIFELAKGNNFNEKNNIIDVLAYHIERNPYRQFSIDGYFESCKGRSYISVLKNENNIDSYLINQSKSIPLGVKFCEGRKSKEVDKINGLSFWWCRNSKCYKPCQSVHSSDEWKNYTLSDFLRILDISYSLDDYYYFLGWVNRINTLLSRLNCRGCGKILRPNNQTNYSFYRVSTFICDNKKCNHNEVVYLSHCLNGKCNHLIDSRDSVKCENGMYICSNPACGDCCSTKVFANRIENCKINGLPISNKLQYIVDNKLGHKERSLSFCYSCGESMQGGWQKYEEIKKWLISNKDNTEFIIKYGIRADDRWWFLTNFPLAKYASLVKLGFQVRDNEDKTSFYRLVSEPYGKMDDPPKYCINNNCINCYK